MGNRDNVAPIPIQKAKRRDMGRLSSKDMQHGKEDMDTDGLLLCSRSDSRKHVEGHGMDL